MEGKAHSKQPSHPNHPWSEAQADFLLRACQGDRRRDTAFTFTSTLHNKYACELNEEFNIANPIDGGQVQNKMQSLKTEYDAVKLLREKSG